MKSTAKREVMTGVITFLVYGILGFAASVLTSLPEAGLDSLAASHAVFIIGSIASSAVLVGGIAFGIVFGRKRSNGYLIGLVASVVFFLGAGFGFFYTLSSIGVIDIHDIRFQSYMSLHYYNNSLRRRAVHLLCRRAHKSKQEK